MRRAYRCPCDGISQHAKPQTTPLAGAVRGELDAIESAMGERPQACPWWAFHEADVIAVLHAYDWHESGQVAEQWGSDPELWLVEATRFYHHSLSKAQSDVSKMLRANPPAQAPTPPIGEVVRRVSG